MIINTYRIKADPRREVALVQRRIQRERERERERERAYLLLTPVSSSSSSCERK